MKKLILSLFILAAVSASAQDAAYNTPVARPSEAKVVTKEVNIRQDQVVVTLSVQTAADAEVSYYNVTVPDNVPAHSGATVAGFITAIGTPRSGETGAALRRFNFRLLGYLFDQGYLPGTTLQP